MHSTPSPRSPRVAATRHVLTPLWLVLVWLASACSAPGPVLVLEADEAEGVEMQVPSDDPIARVLRANGCSFVGAEAQLPTGFARTLAYSLPTRDGAPVLPPGFRRPKGGFFRVKRADARRWIASVASASTARRPGVDVVRWSTEEELERDVSAKSLASGLMNLFPADALVLGNLTFDGRFAEVRDDGLAYQGLVIVVGRERSLLVYAEASE